MARIIIEAARPEVDVEFRRILRENTPSGSIRVRYEREPDFLAASRVEGHDLIAAYAKDCDTDHIMGICLRAEKPCYLQGEVQAMSYLSSLRVEAAYRGSFALIRFFQYLKSVHARSDCKWDLMMITDGNELAEKLLLTQRAGLPKAYPLGRYHTLALGLNAASPSDLSSGIKINRLTEAELPEWFRFLQQTAPAQRELYPVYQTQDLDPETGLLKGLKAHHIYVARENGQITGTVSVWDQRAFKQFYIDGYARAIRWFRPLLNGLAKLTGRPSLPRSGEPLHMVFLATICIENDREEVFEALVRKVKADLATAGKYHSLMAGFHESDPLKKVARKFPHVTYTSQPWLLSWEEIEPLADHLRQSTLYLELGAL